MTFPIDGKINHVPNHQPVVNDGYWWLLSGNLTVCYWKWHIYDGFTWIYPVKMVIFHSYVSLPEGNDDNEWLKMVMNDS